MRLSTVLLALWLTLFAPVKTVAAATWSFVQIGSIGSPGSASQLIYSSAYGKLVLRNGGSAVRLVNLEDGTTQTFFSQSLFTDMSLSPSGRYVFVADYGYENIGYGTPENPGHVGRLDLATGAWESKSAGSVVSYHIESVDDDHFILTSIDQWITFSYNSWGTGTAITPLTPNGSFPGYYASVYYGDIEFDDASGRVIHGNSGSSSQEITAFKLSGNSFTRQESSNTYGSAQGHGGSSVLATDGTTFYYGDLQVDALDVKHNRRVFPEIIYAANARAALGNGTYYDSVDGSLLGSLGFATTVYAFDQAGDEFWAYDPTSETLRHFAPSDGPMPIDPMANADLARAGAGGALDIDVLTNDYGFADPVTVTIATAPSGGTATVIGSPGNKSGVRIRYSAKAGFIGQDSFVYTVTDGANTDSASVGILVDPFKATSDSYAVARNGGGGTFYIARNDVGFTDPVTIRLTRSPTYGSAYIGTSPGNKQDVSISYSPYYSAPAGEYSDSFVYEISDGTHADSATVSVQLYFLKALDDVLTTPTGSPVRIDVTQNDIVSGYSVTVGLFEAAKHGLVQESGRQLTYTPEPGFVGTDSFVYALDDGARVSLATVTVAVIPDVDRDGIADGIDNCTLVANSDQRDSNGDGFGNVCDTDLNGDGVVNFGDLAIFRQRFGTNDAEADFDGNGVVNFADLARMRSLFLKSPGPSGLHP